VNYHKNLHALRLGVVSPEWKRAKRQGKRRGMEKKSVCGLCGRIGDMVAHHEDYREPNLIVWVCRKCHGERHTAINKLSNISAWNGEKEKCVMA
jgi:hypothetical protein